MIESRAGRRVVITGVGVVAPCGVGADAFWHGLGQPVAPAVLRPVPDFDPERAGLRRVDARRLGRFAQFAIVAAAEALVDARMMTEPHETGALVDVDSDRVGVLIGSGIGGALSWEYQAAVNAGTRATGRTPTARCLPRRVPPQWTRPATSTLYSARVRGSRGLRCPTHSGSAGSTARSASCPHSRPAPLPCLTSRFASQLTWAGRTCVGLLVVALAPAPSGTAA